MFWDDEVFEKEAQKQRERSQWRAEQKSKSSHTSSSSSRNSGSSHSSSKNPGTKGNRPYAKAKYRLHPDPDFDPNEYLLADEIQNHRPPSKFRDALRRHRWGLYRIFGMTFLTGPNTLDILTIIPSGNGAQVFKSQGPYGRPSRLSPIREADDNGP